MLLKEEASQQKLRGGYYTPIKLTDFLVDKVLRDKTFLNILEPSCGDGAFLTSLHRLRDKKFNCLAVELNAHEALKAKESISNDSRFSISNDDFYRVYENQLKREKFDLVVGNPPYIRYQYLSPEQREEQSLILIENGLKPNRLINAWVTFTIAGVSMLSDNGTIIFVIPAELMQIGYAKELRMFLMNNLQKITLLTFRELIFPDIEQEVVVLIGEKDAEHKGEHKISILEFDNIDDLYQNYNADNIEYQDVELNDSKWLNYFLEKRENDIVKFVNDSDLFMRFDEIANIEVGITTGNNKFFCVDKYLVDEYNLDEKITSASSTENVVLRPLIARSVGIKGVYFTEEDWLENISLGARTYLLDYPNYISKDMYPEGHRRYIEMGEKNGEHRGYKCSIREQWYSVPSIWVPDGFLLRRNYLYPKLLLNTEIEAVSTDTMHRIRFKYNVNSKLVLLQYYNSITFAFTELKGRSYGGGVLEILPGEFSNVMMPKIDMTMIDECKLNDVVNHLDSLIRSTCNIEEVLDFMDQEVLIKILGINEEIVTIFRNVWLKLRARRLGRSIKR